MEKIEETLPLMLRARVRESPNIVIQYAKNGARGIDGVVGQFITKTYGQFYDEMRFAAAGLLELGLKREDHIGIISDNRQEWLVSSFAILSIGAVDVPRGCDITEQELVYILGFAECTAAFAENQKQALKILSCRKDMPLLKTLITYDPTDAVTEAAAAEAGITIHYYASLIALGQKRSLLKPGEVDAAIEKGRRDDLVTIIFTSGTTGEPKGVMLTHGTFLFQLPAFRLVFEARPGDIWLSVLPVWHVYERAMEYVVLYFTNGLAYSKPISSILMADFKAVRPHWMVTVPRVWEAIMDGINRSVKQMGGIQKTFFDLFVRFALMYSYFRDLTFGLIPNFHGRVRLFDAIWGFFPWLLLSPVRGLAWLIVFRRLRLRLGGRFHAGISGGGSLPAKVDHFFNAVGLRLQEAYGLTETSPIVSVRQYRKSRRGTIGQVLSGTEAKIVNAKGESLPPGHNGILHVRGGQVMKGYYKKPDLTAAILSEDGWVNTGDIAMKTHDNELRLTGRAKDTIVLRGGENVEPIPIEIKIRESDYIEHCAVVGQDQKYLAALIVPVQTMVMAFAEENNIPIVDYDLLLQQPEINEIIANEVADLVGPRTGFKPFERVFKFKLLPRSFEQGRELSPKGELLRHQIAALYAREIHGLFRN
ncbi:long-chain-fatty-acid--CoA ligase [Spirochaetia bacterium]|nr:long-chain-fatty-acid--CoA ligase [Spirochaetia bacterium]